VRIVNLLLTIEKQGLATLVNCPVISLIIFSAPRP